MKIAILCGLLFLANLAARAEDVRKPRDGYNASGILIGRPLLADPQRPHEKDSTYGFYIGVGKGRHRISTNSEEVLQKHLALNGQTVYAYHYVSPSILKPSFNINRFVVTDISDLSKSAPNSGVVQDSSVISNRGGSAVTPGFIVEVQRFQGVGSGPTECRVFLLGLNSLEVASKASAHKPKRKIAVDGAEIFGELIGVLFEAGAERHQVQLSNKQLAGAGVVILGAAYAGVIGINHIASKMHLGDQFTTNREDICEFAEQALLSATPIKVTHSKKGQIQQIAVP